MAPAAPGTKLSPDRRPPRTREPKPVPWSGNHYVGIDENGVGPRLGPMVVTSVMAEVTEAGGAVVSGRARGSIANRIGDSKKLVAFDNSALGEAWARVFAARMGQEPRTPRELLQALLLDSEELLMTPCPSQHTALCWGASGETFVADDALVRACEADLVRLEAKGARFAFARVAVVCNKRLNEAALRGQSRFELDLHAMERLALRAQVDAGAEIYALCGKVGGFDFYGPRFGPLAGWLHTALIEGRARSDYLVPKVGRLAFVRDADDTHMIVGLASLIGKWVRDHLMRRIVRFHAEHLPDLPEASGYHDPVTTRFIQATELVRKRLRVEDMCFERTALSNLEAATRTRAASPTKTPTSSKSPRSKAVTPTSSSTKAASRRRSPQGALLPSEP